MSIIAVTKHINNKNIIYVDKPIGQTPGELIVLLKKQLKPNAICFSGRLDPLAHGQMLCLLNEETKNVKQYHDFSKIYRFKFIIGLATDTTDFMGMFSYDDYKTTINMDDLIKLMTSYDCKTFNQKYHKFSSYLPQEKIAVNNRRKPLWWWSINQPETKLQDYTKQVTIKKLKIDNVMNISDKNIQTTALTNVAAVQQKTFRNCEILEQWANFGSVEMQTYPEITCTVKVTSGFYIRQFVQDLSDTFTVKMLVTDIERLEVLDK